MDKIQEFDVIVVGGGHAGCEACAAAARMGAKTALITHKISTIGEMSCNPAIGGLGKGHLVREIDALDGLMGRVIDKAGIQFRMLNASKGPAVRGPRAQADRDLYKKFMLEALQRQENLTIIEAAVEGLYFTGDKLGGVKLADESILKSKAVILTSGTFLNGVMFTGHQATVGGRVDDVSCTGITPYLNACDLNVGRLKTGTPARLDMNTINWKELPKQDGDEHPIPFSFLTKEISQPQIQCAITRTNERTHQIIRDNFEKCALFSGLIKGIGPRYCPSIEDKLRTFADKDSHQLFLEPEGRETNEYYLNGFSSSLPLDVQIKALSKVRGFEKVHIYRPGYAIEYDYFPPTQLKHTLETKRVDNLYFAGQINGTTGYEEAAAQGLMAGINASLKLQDKAPFVLARDEAYIGVLIDDLVTKGVDEPYRMFTSRAEYRILLRQDNADLRLTPKAIELGLASSERREAFERKNRLTQHLIDFIRQRSVGKEEINGYLQSIGTNPLEQGRKLYDILLRNGVSIEGLTTVLSDLNSFIHENDIDEEIVEEAEIQIKYRGYIERERFIAEKMRRLENIRLRPDFDYNALTSLTIEARQKLSRIKPQTIGQASRIPGVSPADINVLLIFFGR